MIVFSELKIRLPDSYFLSLFFLKYIPKEMVTMLAVYFPFIFNASYTY